MPSSRETREQGSIPGRSKVNGPPASIENLADFAAHELRGPINTLQAFLTILYREQPGQLNEIQKDFISSMLSISRRLERLADDIQVMFAQGSEITVELSRVDVIELVKECVREVRATAEPLDIDISFDYLESRTLEIDQDPVRLAQILVNLLENAVRNSPDGGTVSVCLRHAGKRLLLKITNPTFEDITQDDLARMFVPFMRGANAQNVHPHGSGLGLAVVSHLVAALGGRIVTRASGGSVTIGFVLPARVSPEIS